MASMMARVSRVGEDARVDLEPRIGALCAAYVSEIVTRTRDVLGGDLLAVCLMGSAALGDYRPERSDIDVAVIAARPLPIVAREALVAALESVKDWENGILPPITIGPDHETQKQGFWVKVEHGRFKALTDWLKSE